MIKIMLMTEIGGEGIPENCSRCEIHYKKPVDVSRCTCCSEMEEAYYCGALPYEKLDEETMKAGRHPKCPIVLPELEKHLKGEE